MIKVRAEGVFQAAIAQPAEIDLAPADRAGLVRDAWDVHRLNEVPAMLHIAIIDKDFLRRIVVRLVQESRHQRGGEWVEALFHCQGRTMTAGVTRQDIPSSDRSRSITTPTTWPSRRNFRGRLLRGSAHRVSIDPSDISPSKVSSPQRRNARNNPANCPNRSCCQAWRKTKLKSALRRTSRARAELFLVAPRAFQSEPFHTGVML